MNELHDRIIFVLLVLFLLKLDVESFEDFVCCMYFVFCIFW